MRTVDYNSWQESPEGLKLAASLDKNVVLAEGLYRFKFPTINTALILCRLQAIPHQPQVHGQNG